MDPKLKKKIFHILRSPILLGLLLTALFTYISIQYYHIRALNDTDRTTNQLFDLIEVADLKSMDFRFQFRGEIPTKAPVSVLTIDDESVQEIGRWPWSREKVAHIIDEIFKYGGKAIAMDVIFAEPQESIHKKTIEKIDASIKNKNAELEKFLEQEKTVKDPDTVLSETIEKYKEKIVLGSFIEELENTSDAIPYKDYCKNLAFGKVNGENFIKLHSSFIINDEADPFEELEFSKIFGEVLNSVENNEKQNLIIKLFNKSEDQLTDQERNKIKRMVNRKVMDFCDHWLTPQDMFIDQEPYQKGHLEIFAEKSKLFAGLNFEDAIKKFKALVPSHPLPAAKLWTINIEQLQKASEYTGSFYAYQDQDGTIRKSPMLYRTGNRIALNFIPSIGLQAFLLGTGYQARIEFNKDARYNNQKILSKFEIYDVSKDPAELYASVPVDRQGRLQINYAGPQQMIPYLPAKELFTSSNEMTIKESWNPELKRSTLGREVKVKKADFIKDKIFVFGATAVGIYDLRVTPFDKNFPGTETHATVISNLFDRNFIKSSQYEGRWMPWLLLGLGIILTLLIEFTGAVLGFAATICFTLAALAIDAFLFKQGVFITMILPVFLIISLYPILTFYKYFTEERKKKQIRATFSKYVSPAIVDEILKAEENIDLGGRKAPMTVFFSDVRGFTTFSEKLDPQALTALLNRYLTPMTEIVFQNKGTLDKYMGDAIMAFFGAPVAYPDHAAHACRCALQSLVKLKDLQESFASEGLPTIDIGIGINTGEMNVGNMGSEIVRSYTVMGDSVNLGSRLESINKEYGTRIIISEFVQKEIEGQFITRELDWVRVKGKMKPVRIFELLSETPIQDNKINDCIENFKKGFNLYHQMNFTEALKYFELAALANPKDEPSKIYIDRTNEYIATPPPANWDGSYTMTHK